MKATLLTINFFLLYVITTAQVIIEWGPISGFRYGNVSYKAGKTISAYEKQRCKLDIYIPRSAGHPPFPVVIYFHGGSLITGAKSEGWRNMSKNFGFKFLEAGISMVMVNYRLSGRHETKWPMYIEDAAKSVAWVTKNIAKYGGDPNNIFVMGFSAGAYLTHMLNIDSRWYRAINFDPDLIRGYIPISGQTRAHKTVGADLNITLNDLMSIRPDAMPLGHVKQTDKPMHIFVGANEGQTITDNYAYYEQLINQGSRNIFIYTQPDKGHGGMRNGLGSPDSPTRTKIFEFIQNYSFNKDLSSTIG